MPYPYRPPAPLIREPGSLEGGVKNNCGEVIGTFCLKLIKILSKLLDSYSNPRLKKGVVLILKLLLGL